MKGQSQKTELELAKEEARRVSQEILQAEQAALFTGRVDRLFAAIVNRRRRGR
jgi:hypothetical protein